MTNFPGNSCFSFGPIEKAFSLSVAKLSPITDPLDE